MVGCIQTANRNIKICRRYSRCLKYTEHSDFTLLFCRERLRNIQSFIMHVHKPFVLPRSRCRCRRRLKNELVFLVQISRMAGFIQLA